MIWAFPFRRLIAVSSAVCIVIGAAEARPGGNPNFHVTCKFGSSQASVSTERGLLVFRYKRNSRTLTIITQDRAAKNVLYRYDLQRLGRPLVFGAGGWQSPEGQTVP
jgi:hypothetical protein